MTNKQANRFELREPIRSLLNTYRKLAGADACALYLIMGDEMDDLEKKQELIKRFDKGNFTTESKNEFEGYGKNFQKKYR